MRRLLPCALLIIYGRAGADVTLPVPARPVPMAERTWAPRCAERLRRAREQAARFAPELSRATVEIGRVPDGNRMAPSVELQLLEPGDRPAEPSLIAYVWLNSTPLGPWSDTSGWLEPATTEAKPVMPRLRRVDRAWGSIDAHSDFPAERLRRVLEVLRPAVDDCLIWGRDAAR